MREITSIIYSISIWWRRKNVKTETNKMDFQVTRDKVKWKTSVRKEGYFRKQSLKEKSLSIMLVNGI